MAYGAAVRRTKTPPNAALNKKGYAMYKWILGLTALWIFMERDTIKAYFDPPPNFAAAHQVPVVLYSTDWCGYCAKARQFLQENRIAYFEYDIEKSAEGQAQYRALGGRGVPVLQVNGHVVKGFNPERVRRLLTAAPALTPTN